MDDDKSTFLTKEQIGTLINIVAGETLKVSRQLHEMETVNGGATIGFVTPDMVRAHLVKLHNIHITLNNMWNSLEWNN